MDRTSKVIDQLRAYAADPTLCADYAIVMLDAVEEIERQYNNVGILLLQTQEQTVEIERLRAELAKHKQRSAEDAADAADAWAKCHALEKISQQVTAEPVAWISERNDLQLTLGDKRGAGWRPLYASPPPQRQPLSEDQIVDIWAGVSQDYDDEINIIELGRAIEKAHGIGEQP